MILAGASVDNVFVIILFTAFTNFAKNGNVALPGFLTIPTSIIFGLIGGIITGLFLALLFSKLHVRDSGKVIITLSFSFLLITIEHGLTGVISFSGLLSIVAMGATLHQKKHELSKKLSGKFSKLWVCAEVLLFVLVGAAVNISYVLKAGLIAIALIFCVLVFRMAGVFVCLIKTPLNKKERVFSALACIPKATVQAAIGALPLVMGLACGDTILTVAVLSILITAPLGAALADATYKKLLDKETIDLKRTTGIPGVNRARERLNYFSK